jgi:hypothetical protein
MTRPEVVEDVLKHYGKKGMRWGVRKNQVGDAVLSKGFGITTTGSRERSSRPAPVVIKERGKKLKTSGGQRFPSHPDAIRARKLGQVAKKSGTKALSNQDLQDYTKRLQLETSLKRLNIEQHGRGRKATNRILKESGNKAVQEITGGSMKLVKNQLLKSFK